jgi:predicted phage terminase large subunit-like protein
MDENFYILDFIRDKLNLRERQEALFRLHKKYKPKSVLYERYGMQADIDAIKEAQNYMNYRFAITEVAGAMSKEDRIRRLIPYFYDGRIFFPETLFKADYEGKTIDVIEEFIEEEYLTFPVSIHDDGLDCMSRLFDVHLSWPALSNFNYYEFAQGFR